MNKLRHGRGSFRSCALDGHERDGTASYGASERICQRANMGISEEVMSPMHQCIKAV